jgi:ankyrin repeat protein
VSGRQLRGELLYAACARERVNVVRRLLREATRADLSWGKPTSGWTALHVAAEMRSPELIQLLHGAGAPLEAPDHEGWTPLFLAVDADIDAAIQDRDALDLSTVETLLSLGANPDVVAKDGSTPKALATRYGCQEAVEMLAGRRRTSA